MCRWGRLGCHLRGARYMAVEWLSRDSHNSPLLVRVMRIVRASPPKSVVSPFMFRGLSIFQRSPLLSVAPPPRFCKPAGQQPMPASSRLRASCPLGLPLCSCCRTCCAALSSFLSTVSMAAAIWSAACWSTGLLRAAVPSVRGCASTSRVPRTLPVLGPTRGMMRSFLWRTGMFSCTACTITACIISVSGSLATPPAPVSSPPPAGASPMSITLEGAFCSELVHSSMKYAFPPAPPLASLPAVPGLAPPARSEPAVPGPDLPPGPVPFPAEWPSPWPPPPPSSSSSSSSSMAASSSSARSP
mmetsp:Transcript_25622/g.48531  ORF Transcript_25622/g.48531 Transcript_25622/m.48531 type:complete len:301 (-) Transcript_25622:242-1144(-)